MAPGFASTRDTGGLVAYAEGFAAASDDAAASIAETIGEVRRATIFGELADALARIGLVAGMAGLTTTEERVRGYWLGLERAGLTADEFRELLR